MNSELDKPRLLALIQIEYEFTQRTLALLTPSQMRQLGAEPERSVKEIIAHLSAWMRRASAYRTAIARGEAAITPEAGYSWHEIDKLNADTFEVDKNRSLEAILTEFRDLYFTVVRQIESLSEQDLFEQRWAGLRDPLYGYVFGNTYEHWHGHVMAIRQWIMTQATTMLTDNRLDDE